MERGHGIFLNAVEDRATTLFPGVISRETCKPLFLFLCISTHVSAWTHTDTCVCEETRSDCKDLKEARARHDDCLPEFKGLEQHKNIRINQTTSEENLKMLEIRETQGNVNTLISKQILLILYRLVVPSPQSSDVSCGKGKFKKKS